MLIPTLRLCLFDNSPKDCYPEMYLVRCCMQFKLPPGLGQSRCISTTSYCKVLDKKWRRSHGLPQNPNGYGPLTNLPDYTYLDGRPTPVGLNLMRRLERQKDAAREMVEKIREIDFAKESYAKIQSEKLQNRKISISSKFNEKGSAMLKK